MSLAASEVPASEVTPPAAARSAWLVVALAALLLLAFDPWAEGLERHHLVKELVLSLGAVVALVAMIRRPPQLDALDLSLIGIVVVDACAALGAVDLDAAARQVVVTASIVAMFLFVRGLDPSSRAQLDTGLLALLAALSVWMIAESYDLLPRVSLPRYAPGVSAGQRNNAAHLLAIGLAFSAWPALRKVSLPRLLCLLPMVTALVLTRSRAAWLAAGVGILVAMVLSAREARPKQRALPALGLVVALASGAALPLMVRPSLAWRTAHPYADTLARLFDASHGSGSGRLLQWETSLSLVAERPLFGVGPGQWAIHYPRIAALSDPTVYRDAWAPTSRLCTSDLFAWLTERGTVGLLVLLSAAGLLCWTLIRAQQSADEPPIERARLAALVALSVVACLDCSLQIALGAVMVMWVAPTRGAAPLAISRRVAQAALGVLALGLVASVPRTLERAWHAHVRPEADTATLLTLGADRYDVVTQQRLIERALSERGCRDALDRLEALAEIRPHTPRVQQSLALCQPTAP